jgi:hypothetical protein
VGPERNDGGVAAQEPIGPAGRAFAALKEFGLPVPQIRREKYISSR